MTSIPIPVVLEIIAGFVIWWLAVYFITQNLFNRLTQLISGILTCLSIYLTTDFFIYAGYVLHQFSVFGQVIKICAFALYLPFALLYHASYLLTKEKNRQNWQKLFIYIAYVSSFIAIYLESCTKLTRNYDFINSALFKGDYATATANYFWIPGTLLTFVIGLTAINFFKLMKPQKKYTSDWHKYFWPFIGLLLSAVLSPFVIMGYYNMIPHSEVVPISLMLFTAFTLTYSVLRYGLLISDSKIIFNKTFIYSSLSILLIVILFLLLIFTGKFQLSTVSGFIFPYLLFYLLVLSHPAYGWILTFAQDLALNARSGLSVVNDQEVADAVKYYNSPDKLENSTLLRLNTVAEYIRKQQTSPIDGLREVIYEAVEYFKPKEFSHRRIKQNLKYHLLKMLILDEAEEGQILWEFGFGEYPVKILSQENRHRKPLFEITSPSDYSYTSRNAFIALKKEAIHNIAWRISYLEKIEKRKIF